MTYHYYYQSDMGYIKELKTSVQANIDVFFHKDPHTILRKFEKRLLLINPRSVEHLLLNIVCNVPCIADILEKCIAHFTSLLHLQIGDMAYKELDKVKTILDDFNGSVTVHDNIAYISEEHHDILNVEISK